MKKRTSSRILRAAVSLCLVFALFCTMGMMAFAQADDVLGTIREVFPDENLAQVMAVTSTSRLRISSRAASWSMWLY